MVMVLDAQEALTPEGNPEAEPMPVAPVVLCVIGVMLTLVQIAALELAAPAVFAGVTLNVPVAVFVPFVQPPVIVTV